MRKHAAWLVIVIALLSGNHAVSREPVENLGLGMPPATPRPDPAPLVVPQGLYYVTDTYVADVVATAGATTTYSTTTVHESTGTYARVIDTVATGAASTFDGHAFNGRGALTDGRALAGTYYENFVLTADGFVPVSIVFFQDDSETRRRAASSSPPTRATAAPATPAPSPANPAPPTGSVATRRHATPAPSAIPTIPVAPAPTLHAGIALAPDGPTLASAEVLRGRLIRFWPRAFANGVAVPVRLWRLLSDHPDHISAGSGGAEPFAAQWIRMPVAPARWTLRFEMFTELAPAYHLEAEITITVRSPALID